MILWFILYTLIGSHVITFENSKLVTGMIFSAMDDVWLFSFSLVTHKSYIGYYNIHLLCSLKEYNYNGILYHAYNNSLYNTYVSNYLKIMLINT